MGFLFLAILAAVVTIAGVVVIIGADVLSDAPSVDGISPVPWLIGGSTITCILLLAWMLG